MPLDSDRAFVVFHCGGTVAALPIETVEQIAPMAELARPPGLPAAMEGILNLGGKAVPVARLDRLLGLPEKAPGLYSMLIVTKAVALVVDRVREILRLSGETLLPAGKEDSFNGCVQAVIQAKEELIHVLSAGRILLEKEQEILSEFAQREQGRLREWEAAIQ